MTKVMVIGNAGGGKSTLCKRLCAVHGLPYTAIDKLQWKPGWVLVSTKEYNHAHDSVISSDRWLVDGYGSWESVLRRMEAADTIILVDHALWVHYWWATKRQIKSLFFRHADVPEGCRLWPVTFKLYRMIWSLHRTQRVRLIAEAKLRSAEKRIIHIQSPSALTRFARVPV